MYHIRTTWYQLVCTWYEPAPKIRICTYLCTRATSPPQKIAEGLLMKLLQKNKRCTWSQDTYMSVLMYQGYFPPQKNNRRPIDEIAQKNKNKKQPKYRAHGDGRLQRRRG